MSINETYLEYHDMLEAAEPIAGSFRNAWTPGFSIDRVDPSNASSSNDPAVRWRMFACLYESSGCIIPHSDRKGGIGGDLVISTAPDFLQFEADNSDKIDGQSLYIGHFMGHYGHFLIEVLSRCWPSNMTDFDQVVLFPFAFDGGKIILRHWQRRLFKAAGLPIEKIRPITRKTTFGEVVVPQQLFVYQGMANVNAGRVYGRVRRHYMNRFGDTGIRKVFFSRGSQLRQRSSRRPELERIAQEKGYVVVYPELLDFDMQMLLVCYADVIAGFPGSAMHNVLFGKPGVMVVEVTDLSKGHSFSRTQANCNALVESSSATRISDEPQLFEASLP